MLSALVIFALISLSVGHPGLYEYVHRDDGCYKYEILSEIPGDGYTTYIVNTTSQCWFDESWCSQSVWWHYQFIVVPDEMEITDKAFMFIGLGGNNQDPNDPGIETELILGFIQEYAVRTGSVSVLMNQIPNQPIRFPGDPRDKNRSEDSLIAYTWINWIRTPAEERNPETMVLWAMAKGASKGLTTITNVVKEKHGYDIEKFVVAGPSKRGWTTYLVGACDPRVIGIAPQVISMYGFVENMHHHQRSLGGWSFAFEPYWEEDLTTYLDDPVVDTLYPLFDLKEMAANLTMPKLMVKASLDEFFALDDFQFFADDFGPGVQYPWIIENTNHPMLLAWDRLANNLEAFYLTIHRELDWPEFSYNMEYGNDTASVTVKCGERPLSVKAWYSQTPTTDRRDWRFLKKDPETGDRVLSGVSFLEDSVQDLGNFEYKVTYSAPEQGWIGFFITVEMEGPKPGVTFEFSSEANVVPDNFYFPRCSGQGCLGTIK